MTAAWIRVDGLMPQHKLRYIERALFAADIAFHRRDERDDGWAAFEFDAASFDAARAIIDDVTNAPDDDARFIPACGDITCRGCRDCCDDECPTCEFCYEDPNDYRGMGWVGHDGLP